MDPGPIDPSVLTLQKKHRSTTIFEGEDCGPLQLRSHLKGLSRWIVDPLVTEYLSHTQFSGIMRLCFIPLDRDLITALVKRWREETHTFHLPFGEVTITLQDVNILFGLRVAGQPVTGSAYHEWREVLETNLGIRPPQEAFDGTKLKLSWLRDNFQAVPRGEGGVVDVNVLHYHVRAYLFFLIGSVLFPDKSGDKVQLLYFPLLIDLNQLDGISWGSGVLAYLYRNLCQASKKGVSQIGGALLLLQFWSWERLAIGRPTITGSRVELGEGEELANFPMGTQFRVGLDPLGCKWLRAHLRFNDHKLGLVVYRDILDRVTESQFTRLPHTTSTLASLSPICFEDPEEWMVIAPLICFEAVEWHLPNRCVRQFRYHQEVPPFCNTSTNLYKVDRRGGNKMDYSTMHASQIALWTNRKSKMVTPGARYEGPMDYNDNYLKWYRLITRRLVGPPKADTKPNYGDRHYFYPTQSDYEALTQMGVTTYKETSNLLNMMPENCPLRFATTLQQLQALSLQTLQRTQQGHRILEDETNPNEEETQEDETREEETQEGTQRSNTRYNFRQYERRGRAPSTQGSEVPESSSSRAPKRRR